MSSFDLNAFLPYQLSVVAGRIGRGFATRYRERFGLSMAEWRVIAHLSQADAISVREVHERADLDKPAVSRAAARLEAAGLVAKRPHPRDGRLVALSLTAQGYAVMAQIAPIARDFEAQVLSRLSAEDQAAFRRILRRLCDEPE
ncbi:MAG: MarR family transcriptional regulator [Caulobacterales bacterium]|nr:MarR family transcriptional regulator [Caulobacterales bacterium]